MAELARRSLLLGGLAGGVTLALGACVRDVGPIVFADGAVPQLPAGYMRTSWSTDPFSLGSYSFLAPSTVGTDARTLLAEPLGRLHFAGEATSSNAPATTHGALESGRRAASEIEGDGGTVIVIGAGFAGLGAARDLAQAGFDVVVVEARDYIGGRAATVELDGAPVDLGPSWIQGRDNNASADLAAELNVDLIAFDWDSAVGGNDAAEDDVAELYAEALDARQPQARALAELIPDDLTAEQLWALTTTIDHEFGATPGELAIAALDEGDEMRGGDALIDGGYSQLTDGLAAGLDVRTRWVVEKITHDGAGVSVASTDGEELRADYAIVTIPLGVLKSGSVVFEPTLSESKSVALGALGMGLLDKL